MRKITNLIGRERILVVFTNQLRVRMGVSFGDPYTTSGGKALGFHASCRLRMKQMGKLNAKIGGVEQTVGIKTRVQVIKNRMGPPLRSIDFEIYFDRGIDRYASWLNTMKTYKLLEQGGAWYTWTDPIRLVRIIKFQAKDFQGKILEDRPEVKEQMYKQICDAYILGYKEASENANTDTTQLDDTHEI